MAPAHRLLDLQALDSTIDRLRVRVRQIEAGEDVTAARAAADEAERALGELRLGLDALDRDGARFEHELQSLGMKASEEERRMFDGSIANPKELDAVRREVENIRRRISDREDELLVVLERRDELQRQAAIAEESASSLRSEVERIARESETDLGELRAEIEAAERNRTAAAGEIEPDLLVLYEDLRPQKRGVAAVALVDGVCQGCHEQLSAVELDRLKRTEGVRRCEHCRRILVL